MNFIDEVLIEVSAGKGGDGCMSFKRAKNLPRGGPDGGDGGDGGNIIIRANERLNTLYDFKFKKNFTAKNGSKGQSKKKAGSNGKDLVLEVPCGTIIYDNYIKEELIDLRHHLDEIKVVSGGRGGKGNSRYKSSRNRSPRRTTDGIKGEKRFLKMELRVLADVGLLGKPNAGKSSLVKAVSSATPKVANYEFTTLRPSLGVVKFSNYFNFVISDIPGLIPGASQGIGLGLDFLKHLSRTKVILLVVDIYDKTSGGVIEEIEDLLKELKEFDKKLLGRVGWLVLNKIDLVGKDEKKKLRYDLESHFGNLMKVYFISATLKDGTKQLTKDLGYFLEDMNETN